MDVPRPMSIAAITQETRQVTTFNLDGHLAADPGQFVMLWLPRLDEKPFSLVDDDPVTLTVAKVGPFSARLHQLKVGDRLWIRGPLGRGFDLKGQRILLIAGGYGVAPLAFLAKRAKQASRKVVVIGAATQEELLFHNRYSELGCEVVLTTEDCSVGLGGLCTDAADRLLCEEEFDTVYACGPEPMLLAVEEMCRRQGVPGQVSWEAYMRCGMGVCGSCVRDGLLVCRDGPVFPVRRTSVRAAAGS